MEPISTKPANHMRFYCHIIQESSETSVLV